MRSIYFSTKSLSALLITLVVSLISSGIASAALVAHWQFDNAADVGEATLSSDLQAVGDAAYTASGRVGGALSLDGTGDYLRVNASNDLAAGLPTGDSSYTVAFFVQTTLSSNGFAVGWGTFNSSGPDTNSLRVNSSGSMTHHNFSNLVSGGSGISDGNWHHLAVTYDNSGNLQTLYLDGASVATEDLGPAGENFDLAVTAENFAIGLRGDNLSVGYEGLIDDLRIYDNALSQPEISALAAVPEPSVLLLCPLVALLVLRRRRCGS